jgi:V8-like Glu-specific endopeptidase
MRVIEGRRSSGHRRRARARARRLCVGAGVLGAAAALLLVVAGSAGSAGSAGRARSVLSAGRGLPIEQLAPAAASAPPETGASFGGVAAVGALFSEANGKLGSHFCTASVVGSTAGDLAVTAAHCVHDRTGTIVFVPGYAHGQSPYGVWPVTRVYTDGDWNSSQDQDHDVAFLRLSDASDGTPIENLTGAETLATHAPTGQSVQVIGYPDGASEPIWCTAPLKGFSATQFEFDCAGYTTGTSGGPFLTEVDATTGQGTVIGVIGGYQLGGDTPQVSYAAAFGPAVSQLYATAEADG